jgi:hypothetical protein
MLSCELLPSSIVLRPKSEIFAKNFTQVRSTVARNLRFSLRLMELSSGLLGKWSKMFASLMSRWIMLSFHISHRPFTI